MILQINGAEFDAQITGKEIDRAWDGRASKAITLTMSHAQAAAIFTDGRRESSFINSCARRGGFPDLRSCQRRYAAILRARKNILKAEIRSEPTFTRTCSQI